MLLVYSTKDEMKEVFIYTSIYPYSLMAENFLSDELRISEEFDCKITVIPTGKDTYVREMPKSIILDTSICNRSVFDNIRAFLRMMKPNFLKEIIYNRRRPIKFSFIIDTFKYLYAANLVYHNLCQKTKEHPNAIYYSYWPSYAPIAFAEYKRRHKQTESLFISRCHTFSTFGTEVGLYFPMRDYVFRYVDRFYLISNVLMNRMNDLFPQYKNKFQLSRLGVQDNFSLNKENTDSIELVSCSSVLPLKRVDLIYLSIKDYVLKHPNNSFSWTHIGDGSHMEYLKSLVLKDNVQNMKVDLKGSMKNADILALYRKKRFHTFILLSTNEGLPVVLMEAISSGIPILATKVGGIPDIVNSQTGCMVDRDFTKEEFNNSLQFILDNNEALSQSCHHYYLSCFCADSNYREFYRSVLN